MNIYTCPEHGAFLVRAKFRKNTEDNTWSANKLVYEADEDMQSFYKTKATQARRRSPRSLPPARTARRQSSNNI